MLRSVVARRRSTHLTAETFPFFPSPRLSSSSASHSPKPSNIDNKDELTIFSTNQAYYDERIRHLDRLRSKGIDLYPTHVQTTSMKSFIDTYSYLQPAEKLNIAEPIQLEGRIQSKRELGKMIFITIAQGEEKVQIKIKSDFPNISLCEDLKRGDIISVKGQPSRTQRGELTLIASEDLKILAPCLHDLPDFNAFQDPDHRFRQRYLDMLVNKHVNETLRTRTKIIKSLRSFLDERGFLEVETPMMATAAGGALARPFSTHSIGLNYDLLLRIAPELYLKQLVIGGLDRVYEVGKSFRNEGIDTTHNPEFTTCEFYLAYADYYTLMEMTEQLFRKIVMDVHGKLQVQIPHPDKKGETFEIDFSKPFQRISMLEALEEKLSLKLENITEDQNWRDILKEQCKKHGIDCGKSVSSADLLDDLVSNLVEPAGMQPTFLIDHPILTSPLARHHRKKSGVTERFELFIAKMEICNAYTELNDPMEQRKRFFDQGDYHESIGVAKTQDTKESEHAYVVSLEHALPPTGGWGMGIDRLVMLLTQNTAIREVLAFPILKPKKRITKDDV